MNERKLLFQNPATLLFLGAVPALGASADLRAALGMSAAVLGVLLLSALILGLLRNLIPSGARLPAALLVVAGCASAAQLLLHALLPSAWEMLGFYAAVLAVDLMLFASAEDALDFPLGKSLCSALISGLIFAVFVLLLAAIRELFGAEDHPAYEGHRRAVRFRDPAGSREQALPRSGRGRLFEPRRRRAL